MRFSANWSLLTSAVFLLWVGTALSTFLASPNSPRQRTEFSEESPNIERIFGETVPANPKVELLLNADHEKVIGWITGPTDFSGKEVQIKFLGDEHTAKVDADNTFTWSHKTNGASRVDVSVGDLESTIYTHSRTNYLSSYAYFVVDRSAYRPGQTMKFAGFLRRENEQGKIVPVKNQEVEVHLLSERKLTKAATIPLESDEFGRIIGEYTFTEGDALDDYRLMVQSFAGQAYVKLAEFRKAKVRLHIDSEITKNKLKIKFQALDFLDKGVAGSKVRFDARVIYTGNNSGSSATLNSANFLIPRGRGLAASELGFADASEDERLLRDFGAIEQPIAIDYAHPPTKTIHGDVKIPAEGPGEIEIELKRKWLKGGYTIVVDGVLTDYNGREQRTSKAISLDETGDKSDLVLKLPKRFFELGETIPIIADSTVNGDPVDISGAVVAMQLSPSENSRTRYSGYSPHGPGMGMGGMGMGVGVGVGYWHPPNRSTERIKRKLVSATVIEHNAAEITLDEPGAYKFVCIARLPDGRELKGEVGCVVNEPEGLPSLILNLDKEEYRSDERLTGWIHSKVSDAIAFVKLRDSLGIQCHKLIKLRDGMAKLDMKIPADIRYGAVVEVEFLQNDKLLSVNHFTRILPVDRMVDVSIDSKQVYEPGDTVTIELDANRKQEVDLVVSVFDKSLLGIATSRAIDVQDYFLADERVRWNTNDYQLRRRFANVKIQDLVEKAEACIDDVNLSSSDPYLPEAVRRFKDADKIYLRDIVSLLKCSGFKISMSTHMNGYECFHYLNGRKNVQGTLNRSTDTVYDAIQRMRTKNRLLARIHRNTLQFGRGYYGFDEPQIYYGDMAGGMGGMGMGRMGGGMMGPGGRARGDASRGMVSANGMFSNLSGQSFISHMPAMEMPETMLGEDSAASVRRDFSDSAFWNAKVRTDSNGKSEVTFKLPDSLTNWEVVVTAITPELHVGQSKSSFRTFKPIMVWPMLPRIFTEGDTVKVYGSVHNRTAVTQTVDVTLETKNGEVVAQPNQTVTVPAESNVPVYWEFKPGDSGFTQLLMTAISEAGSDASLKRLPVAPMVSRQLFTSSGFVRNDGELSVPENVNLNDADFEVTLVPNLFDDALESLGYLVEYPHGCVEQTMSRFLPAIAVKGVLDKANIVDPELEQKLPLVAAAGIKRLLELQNTDGGWGWQSGNQTHEMMTPYAMYGLIRAEDAGYTIPNEHSIQRGLSRLDVFINQMESTRHPADRIYCMYVLSHRKNIRQDWWDYIGLLLDGRMANGRQPKRTNRVVQLLKKQMKRRTENLSDYALALALEMACKKDRSDLASRLAGELRRRAQGTGSTHWTTAKFSRWGNDKFEITAAVLKALVAYDINDPLIPGIFNFFAETKRGNKWNSTKDTAMILYAICDYLKTQSYAEGVQQEIVVSVGDWRKKFTMNQSEATTIKIPATALSKGKNLLKFAGKAPRAMFRSVLTAYQRGDNIKPISAGIEVKREFYLLDENGTHVRKLDSGDSIEKGAYVESVVTAKHRNSKMAYVLVENPKPAGSEILPDTDTRFKQHSTHFALREDKTFGVAYHHQQTGQSLVDRCVLHVELGGSYMVPPARAELMYSTLESGSSDGFKLIVK